MCISSHPFGALTLDHITGLPLSDGFDAILVVVDHNVTKGGVLIPCLTTDNAETTAQYLLTHVFKCFTYLTASSAIIDLSSQLK